jgi:hypothetical protein
MLLDNNCGDGNRESPVTNHPTTTANIDATIDRSVQKVIALRLICRERPSSAPTRSSYPANGYNADNVIEALANVIGA